jgi:hypothetical protein
MPSEDGKRLSSFKKYVLVMNTAVAARQYR